MKKSCLYTAHNNPIIFQKYKKSTQNFRKSVRVSTTVSHCQQKLVDGGSGWGVVGGGAWNDPVPQN